MPQNSDGRKLTDRRKPPTPALSRYTFFGRRMVIRRKGDQLTGGYVDRYSSGLFFFLVSMLALNVLDAFFTIIILERGGMELNPIVQAVMALYGDKFLIWKFSIISISVIFLCLHSQFKRVKGVIISMNLIYFTIVVYQIFLIVSR